MLTGVTLGTRLIGQIQWHKREARQSAAMKKLLSILLLLIPNTALAEDVYCSTNDYGGTICSDGTASMTVPYGEGMSSTIYSDGSASISDETTGSTVYSNGIGSYTNEYGQTNFSDGTYCVTDDQGNTICP